MDMCYVNKKIHIRWLKFPQSNVDNVDNLSTKKMFTHVYDISGPHSYQQITVYTIFQ